MRSRCVGCHVAAADIEAAGVTGLAVHVVQALAAYKRGIEGLVNRQAQRKHVFSFTPSEVVNQRERERVEKERRKALKREKRGMKELLPKTNQQGYWKGNKV